ncbi:copper resistance D family protein [Jiella marina]|uniref:copper resistance D family protein n=1 Tax=Jiella sp. LLJ827 TaxID=2917712 RepID=UPI002100B456|nr:CopD family protein [Jiella sp. LLJ827]MCQ0988286.1 CopD family protein [Jiella sp. LLJ827]
MPESVFALEGLAVIDRWAVAAIAMKVLAYGTAYLAMGGALFLAVFTDLPERVAPSLRRLTAAAAAIGLADILVRIGIGAARLSGMGVEGMVDPMMVQIVWESPLGTASVVMALGYALAFACLWRGPVASAVSLVGATLIAVAFTEVGHTVGEERALLVAPLIVHVLTGAFWIGALFPLHAAADHDATHLLHRFGEIAVYAVLLLVAAGLGFAWLSVGSLAGLVTTAYGVVLLVKIAFVALLLLLAAANKFRLVPALRAGRPGAVRSLKRSIRIEAGIVLAIFVATATLTSVTTPPMNLN